MFCSPRCGEGKGLGPEHPSANVPGTQSLDPLWCWEGVQSPVGTPLCSLLCWLPGSALPPPCKLLLCQARAVVVILSPFLGCSQAVVTTPFPGTAVPPLSLPCSAPRCSQRGGEHRAPGVQRSRAAAGR